MSKGKSRLKKLQRQIRTLQSQSPSPNPAPLPETGPREIVEQLVSMSAMRAEHYSGPLPPPQMLEQYNKVVPNGAERIMAMAEKQLDHRHELESVVIKSRAKSERLGTHYAFILAVLFGLGAVYLIKLGQNAAGISVLIGDIIALAGVFIAGRYMQKKENEKKIEALTRKK